LSLVLLMAFCLAIPHMTDLIDYLTFRLTPLLSHVMRPNEVAPYPHDVFECVDDKEIEESIFVDEELHGFDRDEDEPLLPSTSPPELVPASTLEGETP
jgi:hypothetical protein